MAESQGSLRESLREQVGPYGSTVEALKGYALQRAKERAGEGWRLVAIDYGQEYQPLTGRTRYVATLTYERGGA